MTLLLLFMFNESTGRPLVFAHRGASAHRPENSIPSFIHAMDLGADAIELDVVLSKDLKVVVNHSMTIPISQCTLNGKTLIHKVKLNSLTYEQISKYRCGHLEDPLFPNKIKSHVTLPLLVDVLKAIQFHKNKNSLLISIELKSSPFSTLSEDLLFFNKVQEVLSPFKMNHQIIIQSFRLPLLNAVKKRFPLIKTSLLAYNIHTVQFKSLQLAKIDFVSPKYKWVTPTLVKEALKYDLKTIPWTVNQEIHWKILLDMGVYGIITDFPRELGQFLDLNTMN